MTASGYVNFVVFMHIPKTAGTSIRTAVEKSSSPHTVVNHYRIGKKVTTSAFEHLFDSKEGGQQLFDMFRGDGPPGKPLFLCGHFRLNRYQGIFPIDRFATFLRHPVTRALSHYAYYKAKTDGSVSLIDFLTERKEPNLQSRYLAGQPWQDLGFVGLTESYKEDLERFNLFSGMELAPLKENMRGGGSQSIDKKTRQFIEDLNSEDMALYEDVLASRR